MYKKHSFFHELVLSGLDRSYMPVVETFQMNPQGNAQASNIGTVSAASAASLANVVNFFAVPLSGAAATTGFRLPRGFRGLFAIIASGAITGVTGGALAYATQADGQLTEDIPFSVNWATVANKAVLFVSDGAKCYPVVLVGAS